MLFPGVALNLWDIEQYVLIMFWPGCDIINFKTNLNYLLLSNQAVFSTCPKFQGKKINILWTKRAFKMKKKHFSSVVYEGLIIWRKFGRWESDFNMQSHPEYSVNYIFMNNSRWINICNLTWCVAS